MRSVQRVKGASWCKRGHQTSRSANREMPCAGSIAERSKRHSAHERGARMISPPVCQRRAEGRRRTSTGRGLQV